MAAQPSLPSKRTHAVNLVYKIPTDKFIVSSFPHSDPDRDEWIYTTEISVERQWEYPDITPGIWTITLKLHNSYGKLTASISPKNPELSLRGAVNVLRSPCAVPVEVRIRSNADGPYNVVVGVAGWAKADKSVDDLVESYVDAHGKDRNILCKGGDVFVTLTFYSERACPRADIQNLIDWNTMTDCILICEGQEIPAHRAILAAQSPVFAAMFQDEMEEKTSGVCKIEDIGRDVLEVMLKFAYGRIPLDGEGNLEELWIAADRYDMQELCAECERLLVLTISADNAVKRLEFAEEWKLEDLKMAAMKVI